MSTRAGQDSTFLDSMDSNLLEGGFDGFESRFESALRRVLSDIRYSARQLCAKLCVLNSSRVVFRPS